MKFSWRRWKLGLVVAIITGACTALAVGAVVPTMTRREEWFVFAGMVAKDILLFLKEHPVEDIVLNGDTQTISKTDTTTIPKP